MNPSDELKKIAKDLGQIQAASDSEKDALKKKIQSLAQKADFPEALENFKLAIDHFIDSNAQDWRDGLDDPWQKDLTEDEYILLYDDIQSSDPDFFEEIEDTVREAAWAFILNGVDSKILREFK